MKNKLLPLLLVFCLALSIPVSALSAEAFHSGKLSGVTALSGGSLLVTDTYNKVVWRVDGDSVTQYAGAIGAAGLTGEPTGAYHDAAADRAYFMEPWDIAPFADGYAVSDAAAHVVRYIANGQVYTLAGSGKAGSANGTGKTASFDRPTGLAVDPNGVLYVADTGAGAIRAIAKNGRASTLTTGLTAPTGLCWHDGALYVAETGRSRIVRVSASGAVTAFAGISDAAEEPGEYYGGYVDGPVASARFDHPQGITAGEDGTIYVADTGNSAVRAIRDGRVDTLRRASAGSLMPASPRGILLSGDTLCVCDSFAGSILTLSAAQKVFSDVPSDAWFAAPVTAAVQQGIVSGVGGSRFEPNAALSRAMFVTMLSRLQQLQDGTAILDGDASFADVPEDGWYSAPVRWAADASIVRGSGNAYQPDRPITREELATMLCRYAASLGMDVTAPADALAGFPDSNQVSSWARDALGWACGRGILNGVSGKLQPGAGATRAQAVKMLMSFQALAAA